MRVMIVESTVAPGRNGQSSLVAEGVADELRSAGHHPLLVTTTRGNGLAKTELVRYSLPGAPVIAVTTNHPRVSTRSFEDLKLVRRFRQILTELRPDVVLFHDLQQFGMGAVWASLEAGVHTVVMMADPWWICERHHMIRSTGVACGQTALDLDVCATCVPDISGMRRHHTSALEVLNSTAAVIVADARWRELVVSAGVRPELVMVLDPVLEVRPPTPIDPTTWGSPVRLCFMGGANGHEGQPELIAALRGIRRSDYELTVVETSSIAGSTRQQRQFWPVSGLVRFVSEATDPAFDLARLDDLLARIDVLVCPSPQPVSGHVIVGQAARAGVWVVAANTAGVAPELEDGVNASLLSPRRLAKELPEALEQVLNRQIERTPRTPHSSANEWSGQGSIADLVGLVTETRKGPS